MKYAIHFPNFWLPSWQSSQHTEIIKVQVTCYLARLIVEPLFKTWVFPWSKGFSRKWWGTTRTCKRASFIPRAEVTSIKLANNEQLIDSLPSEVFSSVAIGTLYTPMTISKDSIISVTLSGRGAFQVMGLVEAR